MLRARKSSNDLKSRTPVGQVCGYHCKLRVPSALGRSATAILQGGVVQSHVRRNLDAQGYVSPSPSTLESRTAASSARLPDGLRTRRHLICCGMGMFRLVAVGHESELSGCPVQLQSEALRGIRQRALTRPPNK